MKSRCSLQAASLGWLPIGLALLLAISQKSEAANVSVYLDFQEGATENPDNPVSQGPLNLAPGWSSNDPRTDAYEIRLDGYSKDQVNEGNILGFIGGYFDAPSNETTQLTYGFNPGSSDRITFQWTQNVNRSDLYPGDDTFGWKFLSGTSTAFEIKFVNDTSTGRELRVQGYDGAGTALSLSAGQPNLWFIDRNDANDFRVTADLVTKKWTLDVKKPDDTWFGLVTSAVINSNFTSLNGMAATWNVTDTTMVDPDTGKILSAGDNFMAFDNISIQGRQTVTIALNIPSNSVYSGSPQAVSPTTTPPSVALIVKYNGSTNAPVNAGTYTVTAEVADTTAYYSAPISGSWVIAKATPTITPKPSASNIFLGESLAVSSLTGGAATGLGGVSVPGTFAFTDPSLTPNKGTTSVSVTFTPVNPNYAITTTNVNITVLSLGTPWDAWADSLNLSGSDRSPSADPDKDGFSNAQEFAFGTDPKANTTDLVSAATVGSDYVVTFKKRKLSSDATYEFRSSTDLNQPFVSGTLLTPSVPSSVDTDYEQVTVSIPISGERGFIRGQANVLVGPAP